MFGLFKKEEQKLPELAKGLLAADVEPVPKPEQPVQHEPSGVHAPIFHTEPVQLAQPYQISEEQRIGFFSKFINHLSAEQAIIEGRDPAAQEALLSRDLLNEMKTFWKYERPALETMGRLEQELRDKIDHLQALEQEWQLVQEQIEERKKASAEREVEIDSAVRELQGIMRRMAFFQNVPAQNYFNLSSGRTVRSIAELLSALHDMPPEVFSHHVSQERNDFASWVETVLKDQVLAGELRRNQSKESMVAILESALKI